MMKIAGIMLVTMALVLSSGCSRQQVFEGIKAKNQNDCYSLPQGQQEECLEATDISFEEYQRHRKEAEESDSSQQR